LHQRGERDGILNARLRIANSEFDRVEKRMQPDVPPDLLRIVDAIRGDKELEIIFVLAEAFERIRKSFR
jgi:hypothetical protein